MTPVALTIAGSDPCGGAGLQADLKTFHQHGVYGTSVVTLLTVQNTRSVAAIETLDPQFVLAQLDAILEDLRPQAAKTGALGNAAIVAALAERAASFEFPLVVDPVMVSKHGAALIDSDASAVLTQKLLPHVFLITPNLPEASALAAMDVTDLASMEQAAARIAGAGTKNVLIKGGHRGVDASDLLWADGRVYTLPGARIETRHTHGTGCVLSAAIAARLAMGEDLVSAVHAAKGFITRAIATSPGLGDGDGDGYGPVNMHAPIEP